MIVCGTGDRRLGAGRDLDIYHYAGAEEATSILRSAPDYGDRTHGPLSHTVHAHTLTRASQTDCKCCLEHHRRAVTLGGRGERAPRVLSHSWQSAAVGVAATSASRSQWYHAAIGRGMLTVEASP